MPVFELCSDWGARTVYWRNVMLSTFLNGNETGMLIESCAGLLNNENPEECIKRETEEETGYKVNGLQKIFEA